MVKKQRAVKKCMVKNEWGKALGEGVEKRKITRNWASSYFLFN